MLKDKVKQMDKSLMIEGKPDNKKKKKKHTDMAFLTGFNIHHKALKSVIKRHWPILQSDKILKTIIPPRPSFIYRKAPRLRNRLVDNALDPPKQIKIFKHLKGFFKCGKCLRCRVSNKTSRKKTHFTSLANRTEYGIRELITCHSNHVTYVLECPCYKQYAGRTTRELHVRIREQMDFRFRGESRKHGGLGVCARRV